MLSTILYKEDAVMAMIAGTAYCISSFPICSVPNAVGAFCPVIPISLFSGRKGTHFPASKQKKTRNRLFVVLFLQEVYHANFGYYGSIDITDLIIQEVMQNN